MQAETENHHSMTTFLSNGETYLGDGMSNTNFYPLSDENSLSFLLIRWKANKIFFNLTTEEIEQLLKWHVNRNHLFPYVLIEPPETQKICNFADTLPDNERFEYLRLNNDKFLKFEQKKAYIRTFNSYETEMIKNAAVRKVLVQAMLNSPMKIDSTVKGKKLTFQNRDFKFKKISFDQIYFGKTDIENFEKGKINKPPIDEQRISMFYRWLSEYEGDFPGILKKNDAWDMLSGYDDELFEPGKYDSTAKKFFRAAGFKFPQGRRKTNK